MSKPNFTAGIGEKKEADWNSAQASLQRLHILLVECSEASRDSRRNGIDLMQLNLWHTTLLNLYKEVSPKLDPVEKQRITTLLNILRNLPPMKQTFRDRYTGEVRSRLNPLIYQKYWNILNHMELKLREFADLHNMLIPTKKKDDFMEPENW
jgi:hypothetical protein